MEKKYMVTYRYSLLVDIWNSVRTLYLLSWLKKHNLRYFLPNVHNTWRLATSTPEEPAIECDTPIVCYWVSSGTWGSYKTPNKIYVCPWEIEKVDGVESVVKHEILHLQHFEATKHMTQEQKEAFMEQKEREETKQ